MLKLLVKIVVCKLQSLALLDTNCVAMVEHCIVFNVPISLSNQEMIQIIILPNNTVQQDLQ